MKKIIFILLGILLIFCFIVGFFVIRFNTVDNGYIALRDGKLVAVADVGYKLDSWSNGKTEEQLSFFENLFERPRFKPEKLSLPIISILTEGKEKIVSKEEYLNCTVSASAGELSFENASARIKGRGNSTFFLDKKPYKLKFDEKISFLGEDKAKEWTLIANHMDYSLIRNYLAYALGEELGLKYTTSANFVDVYVNGEYRGVYLVCEQVETGKNRVDIEDSLDEEETGYLIELDARAMEEGILGRDYFYSSAGSHPYMIKSPDTEDEKFTSERVKYIKDYIDTAYAALMGSDYSAVCRYLDVESFVNGYILDEIFKTVDVGFSSFYLYKDAGGKLCRGPIWDYDLSVGNTVAENAVSPRKIYAGAVNPWYARLLTFPEFRAAICERLLEKSEDIRNTFDEAFLTIETYNASFERNFLRWSVLGEHSMEYTSREVCEIETLKGQIGYVKKWLGESFEFVKNEYIP